MDDQVYHYSYCNQLYGLHAALYSAAGSVASRMKRLWPQPSRKVGGRR